MDLEINRTLTAAELQQCEHISTFGTYEIYVHYGHVTFLFAIDNSNLISSCFEFHELEDGMQLAHMYTLRALIGRGIGKEIIRKAVFLWSAFELPSTNNEANYYYVEYGLSFIKSCFKQGILTQPTFRIPD